ncbi:hypothetical protein CORC01_02787 [Colletotrichum orchidophilum]|uniref:Uncharacterized protein n=1 Tax=Colletotrichum orchidophilum TaxID=1209926 RepID=A0A1G4BKC9_9PEZI|nr:uncharacterized protein CORC01_02787 [Colletotrichum orchidophilum]OHF01909.1 hypothetical protein CORC01_02787 [Colletotrichum orchidophilum]
MSTIPMQEPIAYFSLETAADLVGVTAECQGGKCTSVAFEIVSAFVDRVYLQVGARGVGTVSADIVWGAKLVEELGKRIKGIKRAPKAAYTPHHPENSEIKGISFLEFPEPLFQDANGEVA